MKNLNKLFTLLTGVLFLQESIIKLLPKKQNNYKAIPGEPLDQPIWEDELQILTASLETLQLFM